MPQVQKILYGIRSEHQTMLFSATLDGAVKRLVDRYMVDPVSHEVGDSEPTVDEMDHVFLAVHQMDKVKVTSSIVSGANRTLVFVRTKRGADRLVTQLRREGVRAGAIHGDLRQGARERALSDFTAGKVKVLVATDVAARGIHVDGVDVVVHFDPPEDEKAYLHRGFLRLLGGQVRVGQFQEDVGPAGLGVGVALGGQLPRLERRVLERVDGAGQVLVAEVRVVRVRRQRLTDHPFGATRPRHARMRHAKTIEWAPPRRATMGE